MLPIRARMDGRLPSFCPFVFGLADRPIPFWPSALSVCFGDGRPRSARFCQRPGVALWQPRDHPEIVRQHAPSHLAALIRMSLAQQWTAQESILENRDARLGL